MSHTPGPWKAMLRAYGGYAIVPLRGGGHREIGNVLFRHDKIDVVSEVDANARLIAAAPDLLEALKGVVSIDINNNAEISHAWVKAFAAIARAEGVTP